MPDWWVSSTGCEVAGCGCCRKEIMSKGKIDLEELHTWFNPLEELQAWLIVWEIFWAWCDLGLASGIAASLCALEFSTDGLDTALEECVNRFECGQKVGWFRVVSSEATCTLVLMHISIRLRGTVSQIWLIERFSTAVTVQQYSTLDSGGQIVADESATTLHTGIPTNANK